MKDIFFIELQRRLQYSEKRNGEYYADYSHYRQEIREDCKGYCVYCDCHENEVGGAEHMNLDHFWPQDLFPCLDSDPNNLVWACGGCNRLKSNHWPAYENGTTYIDKEGFVDRFEEDIWNYINIDESGHLHPISDPATYFIGLLELNRPLRKKIREDRLIKAQLILEFDEKILEMQTWLNDCEDNLWRERINTEIEELTSNRDKVMSMFDYRLDRE